MTNAEYKQKAEKIFLRPVGLLQMIAILTTLFSPILWIWTSWSVAWRVGLTGILMTLACYYIYKGIKEAIKISFPE